jgi:hypothetical protein
LLFFLILLKYFSKKIFYDQISIYISLFIALSLTIWFQAPEIRFGYGPIITLCSWLTLVFLNNFKNFNKKFYFLKYCFFLTLLLTVLKNFKNYEYLFFYSKAGIEKKNYKLLYSLNNIEIYKPLDGNFCLDLDFFCVYKENKNYTIFNYKNYLFFINKSL